MNEAAVTPAERLTALLRAQGLSRRFNPASAAELAEANAVAPLPEPLGTLYLHVDVIRFGEVEPFHVADFIEVNEERDSFGELEEGVFVASDLADGWFFVDPSGFMGLGAGFVFWVDRGRMTADDCVPAAETLIELFEAGAAGGTPWKAPMLGDRAVARLADRIGASDAVDARPPPAPGRLAEIRSLGLPLRLARILERADGFLLHGSDRRFGGLETIAPVAETGDGAWWIGEGPGGRRYASTGSFGWRALPEDRMIAVAPGDSPETAPVLGRTADVWARWIAEDEGE